MTDRQIDTEHTDDWKTRVGWVLLPLRAFLGITFTFAGIQKLASPGFFRASNPQSIQSQLAAALRLSPIHSLIEPLQHVAVGLGVVIALGELAIGIGTLLGIFARVAAIGGIVLSFALFLTVSFHSAPYYTGSDIVFVFAWIPFVIAGAGGVFSLDAWVDREPRRLAEVTNADAPPPEMEGRTTRRTVVWGALAGVGGLLLGGLAAGIGRLAGGVAPPTKTLALQPPAAGSSTASGSAVLPTIAGPSKAHPFRPIGSASGVPVGSSASFNDPATGDTSLVIQPESGTFLAFDAICPHEGCTVQYFGEQRRFVCPCHGSVFNGQTGAVESGPAPRGLTPIRVKEGPNGELYAV